MASGQRVLVVGRQSETVDVLRAVLEPRGVSVEQARPQASPGPLPRSATELSLVVVDEEAAAIEGAARHRWQHVPKVIIGTIPLPAQSPDGAGAPERYLHKPYHYADLLRAIESLIGAAPAA